MEQSTKRFRKRDAILACLRDTHSHPSADWVYEKVRETIPDISLATVYRNLGQMKEAGMIQSVAVVSGQERYDAETHSHTHFVCQNCDAVMDLWETGLPQNILKQAEESSDCEIRSVSLQFTGICPCCRKRTAS